VDQNIAAALAQNFIGKYDFTGSESGYILQVLPSGILR
jgi:hypothetical protein